MIKRESFIKQIKDQFEVHRIVAILGPRQCGKTSIAKEICGQELKKLFLNLNQAMIVYPGDVSFPVEEKISVLSLSDAANFLKP